MDSDPAIAHESELFGAPVAGTATRFGYSWFQRTFGTGALKVQWTKQGIQSIAVVATSETKHSTFNARFVASKKRHWFKLLEGEMVTGILFRESDTHDRITSLCIQTNKRRSQWYGSGEGTLRKIDPPAGFYIHGVYGSCQGDTCRTLGAYFVPRALQANTTGLSVYVADSAIIGEVAYDPTSLHCAKWVAGTSRAMLFNISEQLQRVWLLGPVPYQRYMAVTDDPIREDIHVLVLVEDELITALRACFTDNRISAIQLGTTLRTTEWFGDLPGPGAVIETRSISDEPTATHIGGIFTMYGPDHIKSIGVQFYKKTD